MSQSARFVGTSSEELKRAWFGLPPELLRKSRRRLRFLSLVGFIIVGLMLTLKFNKFRSEANTPDQLWIILFADLGGTLVCAFVLWLTLQKNIRTSRVLNAGLIFEVVLCALLSLEAALAMRAGIPQPMFVTWVIPIIILFPLVVPSPPGRTMITATLAAATMPIALLLVHVLGLERGVPITPELFLRASAAPFIAAAIAVFASRIVYNYNLELAEAKRLGSYVLEAPLGKGGMGEVWRAKHHLLARPAAIKLIRPDLLQSEAESGLDSVRERFEREAKATAKLSCPHTIDIYDYGITEDERLYYVMPLLDGVDLGDLVREHGPLPPARAVHLVRQVCRSLDEAHAANLIHRDIKPDNLYACRYGRDYDFMKVLDFGLVRNPGAGDGREDAASNESTDSSMGAGSPMFMAPEQILGQQVDPRTDVYGLGGVLYWLLTGKYVFDQGYTEEILEQHVHAEPVPPTQRTKRKIPAPLEAIILRCLEKDPSRRPESAAVLSEELSRAAPEWTMDEAAAWWTQHRPRESQI
ncbi:MAG: serine/threonine protein kinase [Candidatus Eisenbacteria bacterium]|uniref:Serine/threonine protein kinase n=1 Tax=Eiseniibacteriota bacterium TaxID=2212470 RepID=A0A7Y2EAZ8_UNCEI|nr:serine/threonine protein kinase [Candidatus Eisenbacteria bacterium]